MELEAITLVAWYATICMIGIPSNLLIFMVNLRRRRINHIQRLTLALATADILGCATLLVSIGHIFSDGHTLSATHCYSNVMTTDAANLFSLFITVWLAIDQHKIVLRFTTVNTMTVRRDIMIFTLLGILATLLSLPVLLLTYHPGLSSCFNNSDRYYFITVAAGLVFGLLVLIIAIYSIKTIHLVKNRLGKVLPYTTELETADEEKVKDNQQTGDLVNPVQEGKMATSDAEEHFLDYDPYDDESTNSKNPANNNNVMHRSSSIPSISSSFWSISCLEENHHLFLLPNESSQSVSYPDLSELQSPCRPTFQMMSPFLKVRREQPSRLAHHLSSLPSASLCSIETIERSSRDFPETECHNSYLAESVKVSASRVPLEVYVRVANDNTATHPDKDNLPEQIRANTSMSLEITNASDFTIRVSPPSNPKNNDIKTDDRSIMTPAATAQNCGISGQFSPFLFHQTISSPVSQTHVHKMLLLATIMNILTHVPSFISALVWHTHIESLEVAHGVLYLLCVVIRAGNCVNHALDPFVYSVINPSFRHECSMLRKKIFEKVHIFNSNK